jgi:hypothetical protein
VLTHPILRKRLKEKADIRVGELDSGSHTNAQLNCVASWRAFWNKKRDSLRSQIAAACYMLSKSRDHL